ncbi:MAG TPA: aldo/keto reductase [Candidatus Sulfotelmatobacter sp.]|nr:aldo/keto reductase [Candidatus Sulfotelmatobacter sp.]
MIEERPLGDSGIRTSALGMGCSRLGSVLADGGVRCATRAVEAALEEGIRFFDTADIYGQGDSERVIGRVAGRLDTVTISTKAGYRLPAPMWALRLVKPPLRVAARLRRGVGRSLAARRREGFHQSFELDHLRRSLHGSLRRLRRERIDVFLLHNPPPALADWEPLWRFVEDERQAGRLRSFGVSCAGDDLDTVWLGHPAVESAQVPLGSASPAFVAGALKRGVGLVARDLLGGRCRAAEIEAALRTALDHPAVSVALLGMSRPEHVRANAALARRAAEALVPVSPSAVARRA